jgi:acetate---CoA ligase (ADP-forming)
MADSAERQTIRPAENLLHAKTLAIVGASPKGNWPNLLFHNLQRAEFPGNVYLINPNYQEIWDAPCYPDLKALPEPADHLLMLVPTRAVIATLEAAVPLGTKAATIYSAGFGEGTDPKSHERGKALADFCEESGIVCCGPNCMGVASVNERMMTYAQRQPLLKPGPVGAVFQSGGSLGNWMKGAAERGIGFTYAISSGNEVSLDVVDYMSFLIDNPETKIIVLMVEGIRRPEMFMKMAAKALAKDKPIIAVKLGRSELGRRQAISHTGSLAGADEVFDAVCKKFGLVRCHSLEDLTEMTLGFLPGRRPRGGRAAIVVNSGGMKGLILDHIEEVGIELAQLSDASNQALRPLIPDDLVVENPLECGVAGFGNENTFAEIVRIHAEDDGVDLLAIHGELPRFGEKRNPELLKRISRSIDKPIIAHARSTYSLMDESRAYQEASEVPHLQGIKATLRTLNGLGAYGYRQRTGIPETPPANGEPAGLEGAKRSQVLEGHGLTLPKEAVADTAAAAAAKAAEIGFPVVLKLQSPEVVHKTEVGGVVVGLDTAEKVESEGEKLLAKGPKDAKLLVQEMVSGTEVILGARVDPQYGAFVMVGLGGIFVEVLKDVALRLIPVTEDDACDMLKELKGYRILQGVRGQKPRDIQALIRAVTGLSSLFAAHRSHLSDLEINPLIVKEEGAGVAAVDVRTVKKAEG